MIKKSSSLALFLTRGTSLTMWKRIGIFDREVAVYNTLAKYFNKLYLVTYGDKTEMRYKKYLHENIEIIPNKWKINPSLYSFIAPVLIAGKLRQCDYYRTDQMDGSWTALVAKLIFRKRLIVRTGYTWSKFIKQEPLFVKIVVSLIERTMYGLCDFATVSSFDDKTYLEKKYLFLRNKIVVILNGINTELFKPLNVKKHANRIIFVGRLVAQKNIINLVKALRGLRYGLDIVGEGNAKNEIIKASKKTGVNVKLLGIIQNKNLPEILNRYRIFVLPSFYEGMPKALLEAMSCGLACIGTRIAGTEEVIVDGLNGLFANTDNSSLRKTILKLINDKTLQIKLGIAARQLILEKYSLKNNLFKEIKIYDSFKK